MKSFMCAKAKWLENFHESCKNPLKGFKQGICKDQRYILEGSFLGGFMCARQRRRRLVGKPLNNPT